MDNWVLNSKKINKNYDARCSFLFAIIYGGNYEVFCDNKLISYVIKFYFCWVNYFFKFMKLWRKKRAIILRHISSCSERSDDSF